MIISGKNAFRVQKCARIFTPNVLDVIVRGAKENKNKNTSEVVLENIFWR